MVTLIKTIPAAGEIVVPGSCAQELYDASDTLFGMEYRAN